MHYKNGREAKVGDQVVLKGWDNNIHCGVLATASSQSDTCNGLVVTPLGAQFNCVNIKDMYHVEDSFNVIDSANTSIPSAQSIN